MRISDWSSDVCSSDLAAIEPIGALSALVAADTAQLNTVALGTRVGESVARVAVEIRTVASESEATASLVTQLDASIGDLGGATVEQKFIATATDLGVLQAQIYLKAQTTLSDGTVVVGGVTVGVDGAESSIGLMAQKVYFTDSLGNVAQLVRSEEHTSELQSLMRISYAVFCLKKK